MTDKLIRFLIAAILAAMLTLWLCPAQYDPLPEKPVEVKEMDWEPHKWDVKDRRHRKKIVHVKLVDLSSTSQDTVPEAE